MRAPVIVVAVLTVIGAGTAVSAARDDGASSSVPAAKPRPAPIVSEPTAEQLAFRATYLKAIVAGDKTVIECGCTAAPRAKERAAKIAAAAAKQGSASGR